MELREYGRVLRRHWWLLLALPLLAGLFSLVTYQEPPVTYGYELQYSVSFPPVPLDTVEADPRLSAVQASEYIADDLTEILLGSRFLSYVQSYLPMEQPVGSITSATRTERQHRLITISLESGSSEQAAQLAQAVQQAVEVDLDAFLEGLYGAGELQLELTDEVGPFPISGGLRSQLDVPLRVVLALVAAVALAFALDYLDDSVRSRQEAETIVGPVLGEIPG